MLDFSNELKLRVDKTLLDNFVELSPLLKYEIVDDMFTEDNQSLFECIVSVEVLYKTFNFDNRECKEILKMYDDIRILTPKNKWVKVLGIVKKECPKVRLFFRHGRSFVVGSECGVYDKYSITNPVKLKNSSRHIFNSNIGAFEEIMNIVPENTSNVGLELIVPKPEAYTTMDGLATQSSFVL